MDPMSPTHLLKYLPRFEGTPVLVVGDLMVDHYLWGKVTRISPEAPVPVVDVTRDSLQLGGAANVAHNIMTLGGRPLLCGTVGDDEKGRWLIQEFDQKKASTDGIIVDASRLTTQKTRVIAHHQHVVRFDYEQKGDIARRTREEMLQRIQRYMDEVHAVVISDYAKGVVNAPLVKEIRAWARKRDVQIIVDPKVHHFEYYSEVTVITPNTLEASRAAGIDIEDEGGLLRAGEILLKKARCEAILITRGEEGMSLFERNGETTHIPSVAREVFDVTGAGDTVVSSLALSVAARVPLKDAARLANFAAGVVVGSVGTATVTPKQLEEAIAGQGEVG
jgi:D-beta-D-heptose 7-phosphate kinase/D-beta-D-heptose 1-phosphate adenosyltransferase